MALGATQALAQEGVAPRPFILTPVLTIGQSFTDNADPTAVTRKPDWVATISPGIRIVSRTGSLVGSLDYALNANIHSRGTGGSEIQNALAAAFVAEVIEKRAFVDVKSSISQQSISAFGVISATTQQANRNRTEVSTLSLTPFARGNIAGIVDIDARASYGKTHSKSSLARDSENSSASLQASGRAGKLGWVADVGNQTSNYESGRRTHTGRVGGGLTFTPDIDLRFSGRLGRESTDVINGRTEQNTTWGGGVDWTPTERTLVNLQADHRYFGTSRSVTLQHRLARSIFRFTDSQDATTNSTGTTGPGTFTAYDLIFAQFASLEPDVVRRDVLVRNYLAANGINPSSGLGSGFLSSAVSLLHRQDASMALQGQRSSVLFGFFRTETRRLDRLATGGDDLSRTSLLRQLGYNLTLAYRLTPTASMNVGVLRQKTLDSGSFAGNDQRTLNVSLTDQIGLRTSLSLSLRHVNFDSVAFPYTENGVAATLSMRF